MKALGLFLRCLWDIAVLAVVWAGVGLAVYAAAVALGDATWGVFE